MDISLCHNSLPPLFSPLFLDGVSSYLSTLGVAASQPIFFCFAGWGVSSAPVDPPPPWTRRPRGPAAPCRRGLVPATALAGRGRGGFGLAHYQRAVLGTLLDGLAQLRIQEGISFIRLSSMTMYKSAKILITGKYISTKDRPISAL